MFYKVKLIYNDGKELIEINKGTKQSITDKFLHSKNSFTNYNGTILRRCVKVEFLETIKPKTKTIRVLGKTYRKEKEVKLENLEPINLN